MPFVIKVSLSQEQRVWWVWYLHEWPQSPHTQVPGASSSPSASPWHLQHNPDKKKNMIKISILISNSSFERIISSKNFV